MLQTWISILIYLYLSLIQEFLLHPRILVWLPWSMGCIQLKGGICVYLWCRFFLILACIWSVNMPLFLYYPHFSPFLDYLTHCLMSICPTIVMCFLFRVAPVITLCLSGQSLFLFVLDIDQHIFLVSDMSST